ncbi:MAG TPA: RidA family protein [Syntrophales bacterium]|nr:RidA family protein [Syntrophales bacterium]
MNNKSERKIINTPRAPKAIGPYAQAVSYGDLLFVSGMIPIDPKTGELLTGDFEAEVTLVLENLEAVVEAAGMSLKNVLKASVFLKDLALFGTFNEIYARYFGDVLPARETIQVARLPRDASIEISVICGK